MLDNNLKLFAKRLQKLRLEKNLSKSRLSELADIDISYIGKIERCEKFPTLKTIIKLAKGLDVQLKDLFDFE